MALTDTAPPNSSSAQRPLRIVFVAACPLPAPRGTPIRILQTAKALAARGHELHVVAYHLGQGPVPEGITVHRTPRLPMVRRLEPGPSLQKLLLMDPLLVVRLRQVLQSVQPDLIHAHHYEGLLAALAARRSLPALAPVPIIYDAHTLLATELPYYRTGLPHALAQRVGMWLDRFLPARADRIIAVSENLASQLARRGYVTAGQVQVIRTGVELAHFAHTPSNDDPPNCAQAPGQTMVYSGNLAPYQGIEPLLQSMAIVAQHLPAARLRLAAEGSFTRYAGLIDQLGLQAHVEQVDGRFAALPRHLAQADLALNPRAVGAGLPQKLLNYMAAGKPIVSFAGSAPGLVHGETAWLVPGDSPVDFAAATILLLQQPQLARRLGDNARRFASQSFTWNATALAVEALYEELLA